jgi:hypothetical protein
VSDENEVLFGYFSLLSIIFDLRKKPEAEFLITASGFSQFISA